MITDANRSASQWRTREREGFGEVLELIGSKQFDAFVTWEPSRAGREMAAYVQLRAACQDAGVLYLTRGRVFDFNRSDDAFMVGLEFLTAEKDAAVIRDRQLRTVRLNAEKGRPHGRPPFGYRRVYDERTGQLLRQEIEPEKGAILIRMVDEILAGVTVNAIATRLNREGVPTPMTPTSADSRGWMSTSIRQLLKNPTIAGLRKYQGKVIGDAQWSAIIPIERWEEVNRILADRARRSRYVERDNHSHPRWLLSFIARCGYCGKPLVRLNGVIPRKDGSARNNYVCPVVGCRKISIDVGRTDAFVVSALLGWLSGPESMAVINTSDEEWDERAREAEMRLAELRQRLDDAAGQYAEGEISLTMLSSIERRLNPEIEHAAKALVPPRSDNGLLEFMEHQDLEEAWANLNLLEQRRLVKMLFDIRIKKAKQIGGIFDPERIQITPRFVITDPYEWTRAAE